MSNYVFLRLLYLPSVHRFFLFRRRRRRRRRCSVGRARSFARSLMIKCLLRQVDHPTEFCQSLIIVRVRTRTTIDRLLFQSQVTHTHRHKGENERSIVEEQKEEKHQDLNASQMTCSPIVSNGGRKEEEGLTCISSLVDIGIYMGIFCFVLDAYFRRLLLFC